MKNEFKYTISSETSVELLKLALNATKQLPESHPLYVEAQACLKLVDDQQGEEARYEPYREAAREHSAIRDGDIEVSDVGVVSGGDSSGAYVAAWIWVYQDCTENLPVDMLVVEPSEYDNENIENAEALTDYRVSPVPPENSLTLRAGLEGTDTVVLLSFPEYPADCNYLLVSREDGERAIGIHAYSLGVQPKETLAKLAAFLTGAGAAVNDEKRITLNLFESTAHQLHIASDGDHLFFTLDDEETQYWDHAEFSCDEGEPVNVLGAVCAGMVTAG